MRSLPDFPAQCHLRMNCVHEGNETRQPAFPFGLIALVPPHPQRLQSWRLENAWYRRRKEVERLLRRLKGFCRIFSCFD